MEELKNNSVVEEDTEGTVVVITDEEVMNQLCRRNGFRCR